MLKPGDRVLINSTTHPWNEVAGTLVTYEQFGIASRGWRVRLDVGFECYAQPDDLEPAPAATERGERDAE